MRFFYARSEATDRPFIFLSANVSAEKFQETLRFAMEGGSNFMVSYVDVLLGEKGCTPLVTDGWAPPSWETKVDDKKEANH
ncbi:hypothetical protein [uncultured Vagococcus sp.]|uniref:hypothetical protein n=1 Tax=uncultured Vagococcus sp. TaxID=189676 RepID=UPI0028D24E6D|nr:hypothetical protein [uncultured Vagococcus sp.]